MFLRFCPSTCVYATSVAHPFEYESVASRLLYKIAKSAIVLAISRAPVGISWQLVQNIYLGCMPHHLLPKLQTIRTVGLAEELMQVVMSTDTSMGMAPGKWGDFLVVDSLALSTDDGSSL